MTPEEAAQHNRTAPHGAQAHPCPSCGRYITTPGFAAWRQAADGTQYARARYCSPACLDVDLPDSDIHPARLLHIVRHLLPLADHAACANLTDMAAKLDAGYTLSLAERRRLADIAHRLQDPRLGPRQP